MLAAAVANGAYLPQPVGSLQLPVSYGSSAQLSGYGGSTQLPAACTTFASVRLQSGAFGTGGQVPVGPVRLGSSSLLSSTAQQVGGSNHLPIGGLSPQPFAGGSAQVPNGAMYSGSMSLPLAPQSAVGGSMKLPMGSSQLTMGGSMALPMGGSAAIPFGGGSTQVPNGGPPLMQTGGSATLQANGAGGSVSLPHAPSMPKATQVLSLSNQLGMAPRLDTFPAEAFEAFDAVEIGR